MSIGTSRLAPLALGLALGLTLTGACSSTVAPDPGPADATPRPDTGLRADALVEVPDTGATPDGGPGFADAEPPRPDSGPGDAGPSDATTAGPCGPIDRGQGPARFTEALGAWVGRCNPELTPNEARSISRFVAFVAASAFDHTTLTYDATAAGQCGCAIAAAPCDRLAWFRALDACDATFVSTATTGDPCSTDFDCPTRHHCTVRPKARASGARLPPLACGAGICRRFVDLGEPCAGDVDCAPGTYCHDDVVPRVCAANAAVGEDCTNRPCVGDAEQVLILPPNQCFFTKGGASCLARGRVGGDCERVECHELYRCDDAQNCQPLPGEGDPCPVRVSVNPGVIERELTIYENSYTCRGNIGVGIGAGTYCTETTTPGAGVCRTQPGVGQPCGLGADLTPFCAPDAYCPAIDPQTFAPVSSVCVPRRTETSTCGGRPFSTFAPNQECEPGTTCAGDVATGDIRCVKLCQELPGGT